MPASGSTVRLSLPLLGRPLLTALPPDKLGLTLLQPLRPQLLPDKLRRRPRVLLLLGALARLAPRLLATLEQPECRPAVRLPLLALLVPLLLPLLADRLLEARPHLVAEEPPRVVSEVLPRRLVLLLPLLLLLLALPLAPREDAEPLPAKRRLSPAPELALGGPVLRPPLPGTLLLPALPLLLRLRLTLRLQPWLPQLALLARPHSAMLRHVPPVRPLAPVRVLLVANEPGRTLLVLVALLVLLRLKLLLPLRLLLPLLAVAGPFSPLPPEQLLAQLLC